MEEKIPLLYFREAAVIVFGIVLIVVAVIGLSGSANITGAFSGFSTFLDSIDIADESPAELEIAEQEEAPVAPAVCEENCGLGNVDVREEGPDRPLDTSEDRTFKLISTTPAHGATLAGNPGTIVATFSENPQPGSYIVVLKDKGNKHVDRGYTEIIDNTLQTGVIDSSSGSFVAEYHAIMPSGTEDGQWSFTIA